jgi:hypothetical protein
MSARSFASRRALLFAPAAILAVAACSDSTDPGGSGPVALSFAARGDVSSTGSGSTNTSSGTIIVSGTDTLRITSAKLVIDELELTRGLTGTCVDDGDDVVEVDAACAEIETGPYLVSLPVNGAVTPALSVQLPAGTYRELEMKLRQADSGDDRAFNSAHPEMNGITVLVQGTYKGQPFTWQGNVEAELELDFSPPMVADGAGNFTVNIDVGRWFRSGTGAIIDPATAGVGQENFQFVAQNIRASFEVFEDDDRNGHDDNDDS